MTTTINQMQMQIQLEGFGITQISQLPRLPLCQKKYLPNIPAVYFLSIPTPIKLLYIGQSQTLALRFINHEKLALLNDHPNLVVSWIRVDPLHLTQIETALIQRFRPPFNKQLVQPLKPQSTVELFISPSSPLHNLPAVEQTLLRSLLVRMDSLNIVGLPPRQKKLLASQLGLTISMIDHHLVHLQRGNFLRAIASNELLINPDLFCKRGAAIYSKP